MMVQMEGVFNVSDMYRGHPKGLLRLVLVGMSESFGSAAAIAVLPLFLIDCFGLSIGASALVQATFLLVMSFAFFFGGVLADSYGFGKMVLAGVVTMFVGYLLLALPLGTAPTALGAVASAMFLVCIGSALFRSNLHVLVGNLYDTITYSAKRDEGFCIFYMAVKVGSMFAAGFAYGIMDCLRTESGVSVDGPYHVAFALACISLLFSAIVYLLSRGLFVRMERSGTVTDGMAKGWTKERMVFLWLLFAVVTLFWIAFRQNNNMLNMFAREYTASSESGLMSLFLSSSFAFTEIRSFWNLALAVLAVYGMCGIFMSRSTKGKSAAAALLFVAVGVLVYRACTVDGSINVAVPVYQQFTPCFVVALTPVMIMLFRALAKKGK